LRFDDDHMSSLGQPDSTRQGAPPAGPGGANGKPLIDAGLALAYLRTLWPDPPDGYLLLWLLDGERSLWFPSSDLAAVAGAAAEHAARTDVYLGCALSPTDHGPKRRCKAAAVSALPGFWADIDIAGPAHKGKALPPDLPNALALAHAMPLRPSLCVYSGHGVQPWWLFKEAWVFEGEADRKKAAELSRSWTARLLRLGAERGWTDLDNTSDLARILRLPGTLNHKTDVAPVAWGVSP
jgi:hypothetical protein